tara:strand:- start:82 stop:408 length:327 start_codon:yes stop_codon:yes gene_type:complete
MKIKVKEEHIKNGQPENCENCAIALAVRDSLNCSNVSVTVNSYDDSVEISAWIDGVRNNIGISLGDQSEVNSFVEDFDSYYDWNGDTSINTSNFGNTVFPFEFEVNYG